MEKSKPVKCKCGADARIRHKDPYVWIECKKKCGMRTGSHLVFVKEFAEREAITQWNRMVQQDGRTEYIHQA